MHGPGGPAGDRIATVWTPYAANPALAPTHISDAVARLATVALRDKLAVVASCVGSKQGSLRALLWFGAEGRVRAARIGGFGDAAVEACVARELMDLTLAPSAQPSEIACDLATGADTPWRVTPERYEVLEVTRSGGLVTTTTAGRSKRFPGELAHLVLAEPSTPGELLAHPLTRASVGWPVLVAIKASGGAPVFVAVAASIHQSPPSGLTLQPDGGALRICASGQPERRAPLVDYRAIDRELAAAVAGCQEPCERSAAIAIAGTFVAKDLVAAASAARRAGLEPWVADKAICGTR